METKTLLCAKILPSPRDPARPFDKKSAQKLAESVKAVGLLQPVGVVPIKGTDTYRLIFGEHRHYAMKDILKEEGILATVYEEWDDQDAEMARIAENLFRNPVTKKAHVYAHIQRWAALYAEKYPEKMGSNPAAAGKAASESRKRKAAAKANTEPDSPAANLADGQEKPEPEPETEPVVGFAAMVANATGVSPRTAERSTRIARSFDADQLHVLDAKKVTQAAMEQIAKVEPADDRARVVNLVAAGMEVEPAIKSVDGTKGDPSADGPVKAEAGMTDREWLEHFCGIFRKQLGDNTAAYDNSAVLYRQIREARIKFRTTTKKHLESAAKSQPCGFFTRLVYQVCSVSHPREWLRCSECSGSGSVLSATEGKLRCKRCMGDGFKVKMES